MSDLIDTTEMYLKTIYEMMEDGVLPLRARIVERLGHSGPTVSQTVARMERDGLLVVGRDRRVNLTDSGQAIAVRVVRKHRLAERLLLDVIGLSWVNCHEEACRWEHVMSETVAQRLQDVLHHPSRDPYGNPIPEEGDPLPGTGVSALATVDTYGGVVAAEVIRIGEPIQAEPRMLAYFDEAGIRPGASVNLLPQADGVAVTGVQTERVVMVKQHLASHLFISDLK